LARLLVICNVLIVVVVVVVAVVVFVVVVAVDSVVTTNLAFLYSKVSSAIAYES
jgi:hypothetical protein